MVWIGVLMGEGEDVIGKDEGVVGLCVENVRISSSCTAFLLSIKGDATAVTGVIAVRVGVLVNR